MVACIHGDKSQQERDIVLNGKLCEIGDIYAVFICKSSNTVLYKVNKC